MHTPRIAIVTDDPGWHGRQLKAAFAQRGYDSIYLSLTEGRIDLTYTIPVLLPGFEQELPAGVFVRGVPGGTLEQVILRLDILHALRELGIVVYNDARAIERTVDKAMTSFLLHRAGIPTPPTWVCESVSAARALLNREILRGNRLVIKPLFGSQGIGIIRLDDFDKLPEAAEFQQVFYLQSFIDTGENDWHDWRVLVIDGRAQAAMVRRNAQHWITNRTQGARCEAAPLDNEIVSLAEAAARAVDIDYAGVDLIRNQTGQWYVTEVNSIPAWWGLQGVCGFNIAERLVDPMLAKIAAGGRLEVLG